jgi:membrane-associated phospholipid phosphatase
LPVLLLLAAAAALSIDVPVARAFRYCNTADAAKTLRDYLGYLNTFEPFGHGLGVVLVLLALHQLDPGRRWAIPRVLACALAAGGVADVLKMLLLRIRPNDLPVDFHGAVWATFGQWLPLWSGNSGSQSFPSAHTATAVGLAAALIWLYPNGRLLFALLATLVGCQRIVSGAHYPSDVLIGAAAGCLAAMFLLKIGRLPAWFDGWEQRWRPS